MLQNGTTNDGPPTERQQASQFEAKARVELPERLNHAQAALTRQRTVRVPELDAQLSAATAREAQAQRAEALLAQENEVLDKDIEELTQQLRAGESRTQALIAEEKQLVSTSPMWVVCAMTLCLHHHLPGAVLPFAFSSLQDSQIHSLCADWGLSPSFETQPPQPLDSGAADAVASVAAAHAPSSSAASALAFDVNSYANLANATRGLEAIVERRLRELRERDSAQEQELQRARDEEKAAQEK